MIGTLRKEIEKAWKMVDVAHEKEVRAKETINQLKDEIKNLSTLVERGAKMSGGQENMVKELLKTRDELQRQTEEQSAQTKVLEVQLQELYVTSRLVWTADPARRSSRSSRSSRSPRSPPPK